MRKNIVLLSDGTGNSAAKIFKTNVWRLYQALDRTNPPSPNKLRQIAFYDDGVGTSAFRPLALLGGAFGLGLKRNVKELYTFLCQNWQEGDDIYAFGFSRGAFTIRAVIGMIATQGVIPGRSLDPAKLKQAVDAAYKRDRQDYETVWGRLLRGEFWSLQNKTAVSPSVPEGHVQVRVKFVGLWDTVDAYGLPIDELKRGLDRWVFGLSFPDQNLSPIVDRACHALALDDERRTFHPVLWNEAFEQKLVEAHKIDASRLQQVWFSGMHSNVGGGYAKDGMAYVSLKWMVNEAEAAGLMFHSEARREIDRLADIHDEMGNSRAGLAAYYRYDPRRLKLLCNDSYNQVWIDRPKIHHSVFDRIRDQYQLYVPHTVPGTYDVVEPDGKVRRGNYETETQADAREKELERAWDLVWWRRIVYFLTLGLTGWLVLYPWLCAAETGKPQDQFLAFLTPVVRAVSKFLPSWANLWIEPFARNIDQFVFLAVGLACTMSFGFGLEHRIAARATRAWCHITSVIPKKSAGWEPFSPIARTLRSSQPLVAGYRWFARSLLPFLFFVAVVAAVLFGLSRLISDIRAAPGFACAPTAGKLRQVQDGGVLNPLTDDPCRATGIELQPGQTYLVEFVVKERWIDKTIETSPAGFSSCSVGWIFSCVAPLRRAWTSDWFAPIIRVGALGLERYGLTARCVDPDPKCPRNTYVSQPFTVREQGELFLYVNDAVLGLWPDWSGFYENNHGAAEVSIKPASSNPSG